MIGGAKGHMSTVTTERSVYREVCKSLRQAIKDRFTSGGNFSPPAPESMVSPVSNDIKIILVLIWHNRYIPNAFCLLLTFQCVVFVKMASVDEEKEISMLKEPTWKLYCHNLPDLVTSLGLSLEQQWYLYDKIIDFVADSKDLVCPKPLQPLP